MALAVFFALMAAAGWGISAVLARVGLQYMRSNTGTVISLATGFAVVAGLTFALYGSQMLAFPLSALAWIILLGILNYPMGRLLNYTGVHLAGVSRAAPILASAPLVAVTLGLLIGGETINGLTALGTAAIIGGIVLIVTQR